jgi:hypothetical protein
MKGRSFDLSDSGHEYAMSSCVHCGKFSGSKSEDFLDEIKGNLFFKEDAVKWRRNKSW